MWGTFVDCMLCRLTRTFLMLCGSVYKNISKTALSNNKSINNFKRYLFGSIEKLTVMSKNEGRPMSTRTPSDQPIDRTQSARAASAREAMSSNLNALLSKLSLATPQPPSPPETSRRTLLSDLTFNGLLNHWKTNGFKRIITLAGAGISTSAGIPDFRSPGTGLYNNLKKYNLPAPTDIFELDYFMENPKPFLTLAKELYPESFQPTPVHYFIRLIHEKNILVRHYTQNIDSLERIAGIPDEKLVEAHGTFYTNHCLECRKSYDKDWMREKIFNDEMPICEDCGSLVKPDIVFFGENLPERFHQLPEEDFKDCDLLIVMGTSLEVYPFASLIDYVDPDCARLLINRTSIYKFNVLSPKNKRDIAFIGDCDDSIWQIAEALGWADELRALIDGEQGDQARQTTEDNKPAEDSKPEISDSSTNTKAVDSK